MTCRPGQLGLMFKLADHLTPNRTQDHDPSPGQCAAGLGPRLVRVRLGVAEAFGAVTVTVHAMTYRQRFRLPVVT